MTNEELKELGTKLFDINKAPGDVYRELLNLSPEDQCGDRYAVCYGEKWRSFGDGWMISHEKYKEQRKQDVKVDEFLVKLEDLCKEYGASISSGCGCCGAGGHIKDCEFEINIS